MRFVAARDGTELYCKVWGEGRPVVLMHGWPLSADSWDDQALLLAENGFKAIAYDRRGFGRSAQPWRGYDYDTLADDLADIMAATGASDATIVGFSMGGGEVARYLSRLRAKNVVQAALIASVVPFLPHRPDNPDGVPQAELERITHELRRDRAAFFGNFFRDFYGTGLLSSPVSEELIIASCTVAMQAGLHPTLAAAKAFSTTDFRSDLAAFEVPTLIVHGTDDKIVPIATSGRAAHRGVRNSKLVEIDGGPHGLLGSHKQEIGRLLLDFLRN